VFYDIAEAEVVVIAVLHKQETAVVGAATHSAIQHGTKHENDDAKRENLRTLLTRSATPPARSPAFLYPNQHVRTQRKQT
jgi:hypothetical protein